MSEPEEVDRTTTAARDDAATTETDVSAETAEIPGEPDERLLRAHDIALAALREITPADTIGDPAGHLLEPGGAVSLRFASRLLGYPGWFWTVTVGAVDDAEPTVLETELLPGDDALLAPEWVPWSVRLEEYKAAQAAAADAAAHDDADERDDSDDEHDFDEDHEDDDFESDGSPILHAGDLDGVDIDELDDHAEDDSDDEDSDEDDEESDEDDDEPDDADEPDEDDVEEDGSDED